MSSVETKKLVLEDLSKEDLVKKCKGLLVLAQKAKNAKELLQEENNKLQEAIKENLSKATIGKQELLEESTFNDEKISLIKKNEELLLENENLQGRLKTSENQLKVTEGKLDNIETENTFLKRQVTRLTDENEQLLSDLTIHEAQITELNKLGIQQREQLLELENNNETRLTDLKTHLSNSLEEVTKLNKTLRSKENEIKELSEALKCSKIVQNTMLNKICEKCNINNKRIEEFENKLEVCNQQISDLQNVNLKLREKVTLYHSKLKKFALTTKELKEEKNHILQIFKKYTDQIKEWKDQLFNASQQLVSFVTDLENQVKSLKERENNFISFNKTNLQETLSCEDTKKNLKDHTNKEMHIIETKLREVEEKYQQEQKSLNESLNVYKQQVENLKKELNSKENELKGENREATAALRHSLSTEKQLADISSEEILRLVQSNKELEDKLFASQTKLNNFQCKTFVNELTQTDENFEHNGRGENGELLLEMNHMNQALKERGESISGLEAYCEDIKKKLEIYEAQATKNADSISDKNTQIANLRKELEDPNKDNEILKLKSEIENLREKLNTSLEAQGETISTSTRSGAEESKHVDLDEVAISELKAKMIFFATENENLQIKLLDSSRTLKNLQMQLDKVQDDLEKSRTENKQYLTKLNSVAENISKDKQLLVQNEETISSLNKEVEKLKSDKKDVENWKKQVGAKVQTLRKELEAKNLLIREWEIKLSQLENDLENKNKQLKTEQESHHQTKIQLDQISSESKKNSVLNLEMQDYEKSVRDLSQKIEKQKSDNANLQSQIDVQKNTINALREQNKCLEEKIKESEESANLNILELSACKKTIANLEDMLQQKEEKYLDVTKQLETTRSQNEELSTELSKLIAEHQKTLNLVKTERDQLRSQLVSLQQSLRETQDLLKIKDDELKTITGDYETYKVRAQSVLRKNQNRDLGLEEKISEELATVKSQNADLQSELSQLRQNFETLQIKTEELAKDKNTFINKCRELENELEEYKVHNEQLTSKHQKAIAEHAEAVRNLKVHADTLSQCYRQQLSEQEVRHNREIIELQSRLEKAPSPVETTPVHLDMPREEGEGSESVESNAASNSVHPIPLERLLASKSDEEALRLKKQVSEQESRVVHLTALLSDTEQDLAKHVQMNKLLKEEIRRQQRSVEREKHAENLEYLKNVVFKFITLNSGDERGRLVPVLNTILKLSPEETQKLSIVAKGDPGIKGWTSYLPTWSSPGKPQ